MFKPESNHGIGSFEERSSRQVGVAMDGTEPQLKQPEWIHQLMVDSYCRLVADLQQSLSTIQPVLFMLVVEFNHSIIQPVVIVGHQSYVPPTSPYAVPEALMWNLAPPSLDCLAPPLPLALLFLTMAHQLRNQLLKAGEAVNVQLSVLGREPTSFETELSVCKLLWETTETQLVDSGLGKCVFH